MLADAQAIATRVAARLTVEAEPLRRAFGPPGTAGVRVCHVDDLLPEAVLRAALDALPPLDAMVRRRDAKERKYVCAQLDRLAAPLRELVAAFNRQPVADAVAAIMGKPRLETDHRLYNGGITAMVPGDFMCPHLDNSHDYDRARRREVVLLYYMSPHWRPEHGGQLELWDDSRRAPPRPVDFRPNRLVIMETTERSWHSIRPVAGPMPRVNVTAYFYAPAEERSPVRLTRFAAWPGHPVQHAAFTGEFYLRSFVARWAGRRLVHNRHVFDPVSARQGAS